MLSRAQGKDEIGIEHVRFQQVHQGIPVRGGEFIVHLNGSRVTAANGLVVKDLPDDIVPNITAGGAQDAARQLVAKYKPAAAAGAQYSEPRLEIFNKGVLATGTYPSRLAWFVEATDLALRQYIWVDAQTGAILMQFSQLAHAKSRKVYTAGGGTTLPGTLLRTEGGPATGDADADNAYLYAGITYDYFFTNHGRDSFDNAGGELISTVHACRAGEPCPMQNAFWNGTQMVYGNGYASADDVVGARADARGDGALGGSVVLQPVGRAERVVLRHLRRDDRSDRRRRATTRPAPGGTWARTCRSARSAT